MIGQFEISKKRWFTFGAGKIGTVVGPQQQPDENERRRAR